MTFLIPHAERIYALMRIVTGFFFVCHGAQKIFGLFGGVPPGAPPFVVWGAGSIELIGGALVALGLFTRAAAFVCSGCMAVAYFLVHQREGLLPIQNHGEPAALYAWVFLYIAAHGPGPWSLDGSTR
jgi:putative oxidoreductase